MANNYLEFSETLGGLAPEEEAWLREQLEIVHVYGDREYPEGEVPAELDEAEVWSGCRAWRDLPEYDPEDGEPVGFAYQFLDDGKPDGGGRCLWFYAEESGYPDRVAHLVQKFLRQFRPAEYWTLGYANTCSKPRAGEFGGGCVFVTTSKVEWCSTWDFLEAHIETFREKATPTPAGAENPPRSYDLVIDGPVLRAEREFLLRLAESLHRDTQPQLGPADKELLEGLVSLTDAIADEAADRHGIDCLLPAAEQVETIGGQDETQPQDRLARLVADLRLTDEDLDDVVHDVASEIASDINNGGLSSQIEYLVAQLGEEETEKSLRGLAGRKGNPS
jgi:hypothetical protein